MSDEAFPKPAGYELVTSFTYNGGGLSIFKGESINEVCAVYIVPHISGVLVHEFYFKLINLPVSFTISEMQEKLMSQIDLEYMKIMEFEKVYANVH